MEAPGGPKDDKETEDTEYFEEIPVPHDGVSERERKRRWLQVPRKTRIAIRKIHHEFGHRPNKLIKNVLKAGNCDKELIKACDFMRCVHCETVAQPKQTSKSTFPSHGYNFNVIVLVDVFDLADYDGQMYLFCNIFCPATSFQIVVCMRAGTGQPKSSECAMVFCVNWTSAVSYTHLTLPTIYSV